MTTAQYTAKQACPHNNQISCSNCRLSKLCLPISLELDEINQIDEATLRSQPLHKGDTLYRSGDSFSSIYAVRSGSVKTTYLSEDGDEQITGFYLPGEIVGLDGLNNNLHRNTAVAMETTSICEMPFNKLEQLSKLIPSLQRHLFQLMSKEITRDQQLITLLNNGSAEQRVAALLLSLSSRYQYRQLSPTEFMLPMSRTELGNYLGLTIETVSRVFSKMQSQGLISTQRRLTSLLDINRLRDIAISN